MGKSPESPKQPIKFVYIVFDLCTTFIITSFRFIGSENPETYFTDTERTRVCYEILETAPYGKRQKGEIGE